MGTYSFIFFRFLSFPIQSVFNLTFAHCFLILSLLRSTFLCVFFPSSSLPSSSTTLFFFISSSVFFYFYFSFSLLPSYFMPSFSLHFGPDSYNSGSQDIKIVNEERMPSRTKVHVPYLIHTVPQIALRGSKQRRVRSCSNLPLVGVHSL